MTAEITDIRFSPLFNIGELKYSLAMHLLDKIKKWKVCQKITL